MKKIFAIQLAFVVLSFVGCSTEILQRKNFISVGGKNFMLDESPIFFAGTNFWYGAYLGAEQPIGNRERLINELDELENLGIKNLRILAGSETAYIKNTLPIPIQINPGEINEDILSGLDFLLFEMSKRNMHAVLFLNNYWEWSGGFVVYNQWTNFGDIIDPYVDEEGWGGFMNYSAKFYQNTEGNKYFLDYIERIIKRENKFSNKYYYEDPTIMAWELANEPRPGADLNSLANQFYYYDWINRTAAFIKSIDPNHLVTTGSEGFMGSLQTDSIFIKAHKIENIDYATFHLWPKNWGWYDAKRNNETFDSTLIKAKNYFDKHMKLAREINKPIVLEEFGLSRDNEDCSPNSKTSVRDKYLTFIYKTIEDSIENGAPIAGSNFWGWSGKGRTHRKDFIWRIGDDYLADPPQEPQGFNSVFDIDTSTINIIKKHSAKMNAFSQSKN
ncbi:MAG: mannanase [Ignavibacteriales bacterium]